MNTKTPVSNTDVDVNQEILESTKDSTSYNDYSSATVKMNDYIDIGKLFNCNLPLDPTRFAVNVGSVRMKIGENNLHLGLSSLPGSTFVFALDNPESLILRFDDQVNIFLNKSSVQEDCSDIVGPLAEFLDLGYDIHLRMKLNGHFDTKTGIAAVRKERFTVEQIVNSEDDDIVTLGPNASFELEYIISNTEFIGYCPLIYPVGNQLNVPNESSFKRVSKMNEAFGNPKGDPKVIDLIRVHNQCKNIADEYGELMIALGADPVLIRCAVADLKLASMIVPTNAVDIDGARDALCDVHVFAYGAHHFLGMDADDDMSEVTSAVMSRFIKSDEDKIKSIEYHACRGVTDVYFTGEYPSMVMKSSCDQPDAPKDKFLKAASYYPPTFRQY